jgi:Winged helix-turn helix
LAAALGLAGWPFALALAVSGVWTGPRIGDLIRKAFGVRYHNHHVRRLLHQLGFSVQRPRNGSRAPIAMRKRYGSSDGCRRSKNGSGTFTTTSRDQYHADWTERVGRQGITIRTRRGREGKSPRRYRGAYASRLT